MKKSVTIILLSLMLFNMVGYRFVFTVLDKIASEKQDTRIDEGDYDEASLIEIKVPLNMPYQQRFTEFERHYGEITVDGIVYTYVKMKVDDNMLILKCIPDFNRLQIKKAENELAKANANQDMDGKKQNASAGKSFASDYDDKNYTWTLQIKPAPVTLYVPYQSTSLQDVLLKIPHQPPRC